MFYIGEQQAKISIGAWMVRAWLVKMRRAGERSYKDQSTRQWKLMHLLISLSVCVDDGFRTVKNLFSLFKSVIVEHRGLVQSWCRSYWSQIICIVELGVHENRFLKLVWGEMGEPLMSMDTMPMPACQWMNQSIIPGEHWHLIYSLDRILYRMPKDWCYEEGRRRWRVERIRASNSRWPLWTSCHNVLYHGTECEN